MLEQKLKIHVTKIRGVEGDYVQITSEDGISVNIVLLAPEVVIEDRRDDD